MIFGAVMTTPGIGPATVGVRGSELLSREHAPAQIDRGSIAATHKTLRFMD
jgi:hypothetical protein